MRLQWPAPAAGMKNAIGPELGYGPYKPMDGSHLCHHEHCLIHLDYESAVINVDRWNCCLKARFLRQDRSEICDKYSPPCMMQHAARSLL